MIRLSCLLGLRQLVGVLWEALPGRFCYLRFSGCPLVYYVFRGASVPRSKGFGWTFALSNH
jgi:hypothetical protein